MNWILWILLDKAISIYTIIIIVSVILSWLPEMRNRYREFSRLLDRITEPAFGPFRRLLSPQKTGGLDLSPMLALIALGVLRQLLFRIFATG